MLVKTTKFLSDELFEPALLSVMCVVSAIFVGLASHVVVFVVSVISGFFIWGKVAEAITFAETMTHLSILFSLPGFALLAILWGVTSSESDSSLDWSIRYLVGGAIAGAAITSVCALTAFFVQIAAGMLSIQTTRLQPEVVAICIAGGSVICGLAAIILLRER